MFSEERAKAAQSPAPPSVPQSAMTKRAACCFLSVPNTTVLESDPAFPRLNHTDHVEKHQISHKLPF